MALTLHNIFVVGKLGVANFIRRGNYLGHRHNHTSFSFMNMSFRPAGQEPVLYRVLILFIVFA